MTELEQLRKEVERLTEALNRAHRIQEGLSRDKDDAFRLLQVMVYRQSPSHEYRIHAKDIVRFDPKRWRLAMSKCAATGDLILKLRE